MIPVPVGRPSEPVPAWRRLRNAWRRLRRLGRILAEGFEPVDLTPARDYSVTGTGQIIYHHHPDACAPWPCPFHAPSPHHMATWPTHLHHDFPLVERVCEHDETHPDPDSVRYLSRMPAFAPCLGPCECYCGCCDVPRIGAPIVDGG